MNPLEFVQTVRLEYVALWVRSGLTAGIIFGLIYGTIQVIGAILKDRDNG